MSTILLFLYVAITPVYGDMGSVCDTGVTADCDGDGISIEDGDCDDTDDTVSPSASEVCGDLIDNDCDTQVDESCDNDGDGYKIEQGDCDDNNLNIHPGAVELCSDEIDNNCDGLFNEDCNMAAQQGQLQGGGACTGGSGIGGTAFLVLPLLGLFRRKRVGS